MRFTGSIVLLLPLLFSAGCSNGAPPAHTQPISPLPSFLQAAADGIDTFQSMWYVQQTGSWGATGWDAMAVTMLANYSKLSNSTQYLSVISNAYSLNPNASNGFLAPYYDNEGVWGLAWIDAYDVTGNQAYLTTTGQIFSDITGGWDSICGGGVWWDKARTYKAAIENELFLSLAANLALRTTDAQQQAAYLAWAQEEWQWFSQSGMINTQNLINNGLTSTRRNDGGTILSYNQGVILGGLTALSALTHDQTLLASAQSIALATISNMTDGNGILHDSCEPLNCLVDGAELKGVFTRNLATLNSAAPQQQYVTFLQANAKSIWNNDQGPSYEFALVWSGPFYTGAPYYAATQTSAIQCFLAAAQVSSGNN